MDELSQFIDTLDKVKNYFLAYKGIYGERLESNVSGEKLPYLHSEHALADLVKLSREVADCKNCSLSAYRKNVVFGKGDYNSDILLIGEAPGKFEDIEGVPFVGEAGKLLDKILAAIDLKTEQVYITNVVKCRPPNNRDPEPHERIACFPILKKQLEIIEPKFILLLGRIAAHEILKTQRPLSVLRNRVYKKYGALIVVTYHPAALLRNQSLKRETWADVQLFQKCFTNKYDGEIIDLDRTD